MTGRSRATRRVDFARLNHILIPKTAEERERWRRGPIARTVFPLLTFVWGALTEEGRTFLVVTLLLGAFGADVHGATVYVLFALGMGLLVGCLVAARRLRIDDVDVTVVAPRHVTVGEPISFEVTCAHRDANASAPPPIRVRGPFLTWDGAWLEGAPREVVLEAGARAAVTLRARFTARGLHALEEFSAGGVVPLGLSVGPRRWTPRVKVHVVPRVAQVTRLSMPVTMRHQPGGVALASKSGEAMDLHGVRPYRPGDPVRDLHARSWARTGQPVVREYQQEYFTRVGVVLDADASDPDVLEASIEVAAGIVAHLTRGEALVDVLVVGDHVHELTVGRSLGTLEQVLELLAAVEGTAPLRAGELVPRLAPYLDRLSRIVIVARGRGEEEKALARQIEGRGVACTTVVVDDDVVRAVRAKEPLAW